MHILAEFTPLDPVSGDRVTLRAASAQDRAITALGGQRWWPAISDMPSLGIRLFDGNFSSEVDPGGMAMTVLADKLTRIDPNALRYLWAGARVTLYAGESGDAWPWEIVFKGLVDRFEAEGSRLKLTASVDTEPFEKDALTLAYAGTTGLEGDANIKNRVKPWVFGRALNVEPVLLSAVDSVFQFSAYGPIEAVTALYERASDFGPSIGDYADYAALVAATIPAGRWATCLAQGLVRLGAPPYGVITGDVDGDKPGGVWIRKTGEIISRIAANAGVAADLIDDASLDALDAAVPYPINLVLTEQASVLDVARRLALPCNAQAGVSWLGKLFAVRVAVGTPAITLHAQGRRKPRVTSSVEADVRPPYWRLEMGAQRAWRVHSFDEIATSAQLIDRGRYDEAETYREGNIVDLANGSRWVYVSTTPTAGNAPDEEGSVYWQSISPGYTAASSLQIEWSADGETDWHAEFVEGADHYMRTSSDGGTTWSAAIHVVQEAGTGATGNKKQHVFKRSASQPATPSAGGVPSGWFDGPPTGTDPLWMTVSEQTADGAIVVAWSAPVRLDGTAAPATIIQWSPDGSTSWGNYQPGDKYIRTSTDGGATWSTPVLAVGETGETGNFKQHVFLRSNSVPAAPVGNGLGGWYDGPPAGDAILWMSVSEQTAEGVLVTAWSDPARIDGEDGADAPETIVQWSPNGSTGWGDYDAGDRYLRTSTDGGLTWSAAALAVGEDGSGTNHVFMRSASQPATPTGNGTPAGWSDGPPTGSNPLWMSTAKQSPDGVTEGSWSVPIRLDAPALQMQWSPDGSTSWGDYQAGDQWLRTSNDGGLTWSTPVLAVGETGGMKQHVFRRSASQPSTPTGSGTPSGWSDGPPVGTDPLWMSTAEQTADGTLVGSWSTPVRLDGDEGADAKLLFVISDRQIISYDASGQPAGGGTQIGTLINLANMSISGSTATKVSGGSSWTNASFYTAQGSAQSKISWRASQTGLYFMIGLDQSPSGSSNYAAMDFAMECGPGGSLGVYLSGSFVGTVGTYTTSDTLSVEHEGSYVYFKKNGSTLYSAFASSGTVFYGDSSFYSQGAAANSITFEYQGSSNGQTTTFTAQKQNTTATPSWSLTDMNGNARTPVTSFLSSSTGNSVTMTVSQFDSARNGTEGVIVTGTITDGETLSDKISVVRSVAGSDGDDGAPGEDGVSVELTGPESVAIACDASGNPKPGALAAAGGTMRLRQGGSLITSGDSYTMVGTPTNCGATINSSTGVYSVSSISANTASFTLRAIYNGQSYDKTVVLAKAIDGAAADFVFTRTTTTVSVSYYVEVASVDLVVAPGATLQIAGGSDYTVNGTTNPATYAAEIKLTYQNVSDGGAETDLVSASGTSSTYQSTTDGNGDPQVNHSPGSASASGSVAGPSSAKLMRARLYVRKSFGNGNPAIADNVVSIRT